MANKNIEITQENTSYDELLKMYKKQSRRLAKIIKMSDRQAITIMELKEKFEKMSYIDPLTQIPNRRYFFEFVEKKMVTSKEGDIPLSLAMIDIDKFKVINDTYGHDIGDIVIKSLAQEVTKVLRDEDVVARFGGEEFMIVFPNTTLQEAVLKAQEINKTIEACHPYKELQYTVSIGVAEFDFEKDSLDDVIKKVDANLYIAKENGRNQVRY